MFTNRKNQLLGATVLIIAAVLVTLSAVKAPAPTLIPVTGSNAEGLAIYQASERSANEANQKGFAIYEQSERVLAYPANSNEAGEAQYHASEWISTVAIENGMDIYHQSERNTTFEPVDGMAIYHQSEWFGK
jgi:hypothetical protein